MAIVARIIRCEDQSKRDKLVLEAQRIKELFCGIEEDSEKTPKLILSYEKLLLSKQQKISHSNMATDNRLPESEEENIISYFESYGFLVLTELFNGNDLKGLAFVFRNNLPTLKKHLMDNFMDMFLKRIELNANIAAHNSASAYLILSNPQYDASRCFDLSNYPLGKFGKHRFYPSDIKSTIPYVLGKDTPEVMQKKIREAILKIPELEYQRHRLGLGNY